MRCHVCSSLQAVTIIVASSVIFGSENRRIPQPLKNHEGQLFKDESGKLSRCNMSVWYRGSPEVQVRGDVITLSQASMITSSASTVRARSIGSQRSAHWQCRSRISHTTPLPANSRHSSQCQRAIDSIRNEGSAWIWAIDPTFRKRIFDMMIGTGTARDREYSRHFDGRRWESLCFEFPKIPYDNNDHIRISGHACQCDRSRKRRCPYVSGFQRIRQPPPEVLSSNDMKKSSSFSTPGHMIEGLQMSWAITAAGLVDRVLYGCGQGHRHSRAIRVHIARPQDPATFSQRSCRRVSEFLTGRRSDKYLHSEVDTLTDRISDSWALRFDVFSINS
jgi:hypothetical protein